MTTSVCWSCGAARAPTDALCASCGKVQPVPPIRTGEPSVIDKFAVLGVGRGFDQDEAALEDRFRALSRRLHPDRFARGTSQERRFALEQTTRLNDAWRTLKDPVRRAEHLLELRGVHLAGERRAEHGLPVTQPVTMSPEFLEQMMEDREKLMDAKLEGGPGAVVALAKGMQEKRDQTLASVARMLRSLEAGESSNTTGAGSGTGPGLVPGSGQGAECTPAQIAEELARLRYYARYLDEVEGRPVEV
jgi:molecular chaperone HscB